MECPANSRIVPLGRGLAYVVEQCRPSEPDVRLRASLCSLVSVSIWCIILQTSFRNGLGFECRNIVNYLKRVGKIILMSMTFNGFDSLDCCQLRKYHLKQSGLVQQVEAHRRRLRHENFVQFLDDALL